MLFKLKFHFISFRHIIETNLIKKNSMAIKYNIRFFKFNKKISSLKQSIFDKFFLKFVFSLFQILILKGAKMVLAK